MMDFIDDQKIELLLILFALEQIVVHCLQSVFLTIKVDLFTKWPPWKVEAYWRFLVPLSSNPQKDGNHYLRVSVSLPMTNGCLVG